MARSAKRTATASPTRRAPDAPVERAVEAVVGDAVRADDDRVDRARTVSDGA
jgi:hypothetical protein